MPFGVDSYVQGSVQKFSLYNHWLMLGKLLKVENNISWNGMKQKFLVKCWQSQGPWIWTMPGIAVSAKGREWMGRWGSVPRLRDELVLATIP